jgi:hypothetical protein
MDEWISDGGETKEGMGRGKEWGEGRNGEREGNGEEERLARFGP